MTPPGTSAPRPTDPTAAPRPRRRRSDRAVANDERILNAAVAVLREDGFDGLGMSHVARAAGLHSTGALYGRFENVAELAVWVWTRRAGPALWEATDRAVALLDADPTDPATAVAARTLGADLSHPEEDLQAGLELLAVARRVEELDEVVRPDVEACLARWGATASAPARRRAQVLGQLALTWGIGLLSLPSTSPDLEWWLVLHGTAGLSEDRSRFRTPLEPLPPLTPVIDTGEAVRDVVLRAAGSVVARTGFERATVSRIARRAGYSTGVIYEYYDRKEQMVAELVEVLLETIYDTVADRDGELIGQGRLAKVAGALLAGHLLPEAAELQGLKTEVYLSAAHNKNVADALGRAVGHRAAAMRERLRAAGMSDAEATLAPFAGRAIDHGIALVAATAGPLDDVDWRLYMQALTARGT